MNHDMGRYALENGPDLEECGVFGIEADEPITCPACDGECVVEDDRGREYRCRVCKGEGVIEP